VVVTGNRKNVERIPGAVEDWRRGQVGSGAALGAVVAADGAAFQREIGHLVAEDRVHAWVIAVTRLIELRLYLYED
jgi:hypothetical protein